MSLLSGVLLGDVDTSHRQTVPHSGRQQQEERVDNLVVGRSAVSHSANETIMRDEFVHQHCPRLVAMQAQRAPVGVLSTHLVLEHEEARQVAVVALELRACGLDHVPISIAC